MKIQTPYYQHYIIAHQLRPKSIFLHTDNTDATDFHRFCLPQDFRKKNCVYQFNQCHLCAYEYGYDLLKFNNLFAIEQSNPSGFPISAE